MKTLFYIISFTVLFFSCENKNYEGENFTDLIDMENPPEITFEEEEINFGTIVEGKQIYRKINFKNTGKGPLLISDVNGSCGCTIPKNWPKEPVKVGESASLEVHFNSEGRPGETNKYIIISANTNPRDSKIKITGTVVGPTN